MKQKIGYVDGFVLVVPKKNIKAYRAMAKDGVKLWMKHGALECKECVGDDLNSNMGGMTMPTFIKTAKAKPNETVVFSYIGYKSRAHRDQVNARVMKDPYMNTPKQENKPMPFDPKRMAYGGFKVIVGAQNIME